MVNTSTAKPGVKDVLKQVQPMIENVAGFVIGNLAINMANKMLKIDPADTSQKGFKKMLPPLAVSAGAMYGATKVEQPMLKNILQGAAIAGAYKTAKTLMPTATFLAGDGLGLTPVAAVSNNDRWLYHERTPISGMGFPDLGDVQPPAGQTGYYIDAPAYMGEPEQDNNYLPPTNYMRGADESLYGNEEEQLHGEAGAYNEQMYGQDDIQIL
ncbi:hypothetical protein CAP35_01185 [Chitinophagaceae bacterium IBVUCB1]|nr:hypothetical protein CAP35_01185 [Chitinophagaceae bacterium IBVUCB1]